MVPLARKTGAISALVYSAASAWLPANRRWTRSVNPSALYNTSCTHCVCDTLLQPASVSAPALRPTLRRKLRRLDSLMRTSRIALDKIAARDHRADIVPGPGEYDHDDGNDEKRDKGKGTDEMNRARALAAIENPQQPGKCCVHCRRHRQSGQHNERPENEDDGEVSELLQ